MFHFSRRFWALTAISCACLTSLAVGPVWAETDSQSEAASRSESAEDLTKLKIPKTFNLLDVSGLAVLDNSSVIVASDTKKHSNKPRLTAVTFVNEKCHIQPIDVAGWHSLSDRSRDLEAICAVPDKPGYFYASESGYYMGEGGRIFLVKVSKDKSGKYVASNEGWFEPFPTTEKNYSTPDEVQIEGMAACADPNGVGNILVLGLRGSAVHPATLVVGRLLEGSFKPERTYEVDLHSYLKACRSISAIYLRPNGKDYTVIVSATADNGDLGPFWSGIFSIGKLDPKTREFKFHEIDQLFHVDGIKIEALCAAPKALEPSIMMFGSDDESYGGIIRPLY